jgi:hypothetical protein
LAHIKLVAELRVCKVSSDAGISHELGLCLGAEHSVILSFSCCLLLAALIKALFDLGIVGVQLQAFLIGSDRLVKLAHLLKSHRSPLVPLIPVRFHLNALIGIL